MNVGFFHHKGHEINYFITGNNAMGYSASAKIYPSRTTKVIYIPLQLPEHNYTNSVAAEDAIMQWCKAFIDERLTENETIEEMI